MRCSFFHSPECVFVLAETGALTVHAVFALCTHPVPAVWPTEARLAQTASVDVVAPCTVSTVTHTFTVLAIRSCSTLLVAPEDRNMGRHTDGPQTASGDVVVTSSQLKDTRTLRKATVLVPHLDNTHTHLLPVKPLAHRHCPVSGSHLPLLWQTHSSAQFGPNRPSGHRSVQTAPCRASKETGRTAK